VGVTRIVVHIDRLVLNGYRPDDRQAIAAAVQAELAHLVSTDAGLARLMDLARVPPVRVTAPIAHAARPAAVGRAVARSVVREGGR
jgi:hypothetical protein